MSQHATPTESGADIDEPEVQDCQICCGPRRNVETVVLKPWAPIEVEACPTCRFMYDIEARDGCLGCGTEDTGFYFEIEADIGDVGFPGTIAGSLCEDCAGHTAFQAISMEPPMEAMLAGDPDPEFAAKLAKEVGYEQ